MDALDSSSSRYRTGSHFRPVDAADEPRDAEIQATLAEAEALVLDGQFRPALRLIVKAINMCPCEPAGQGKQRHPKDKSCHIDQCMLAVNSGDPYALFEVAKSPCTCGYRWPSCTHQHHAAALDALANCLDRDAQYVAAFAAALAIIRLDPASAMGYCRGARIIRYLLKSASPHGDSAQGRAVTTIFNQFTGASSPLFLRAVLKRFVRGGVRIIDRHRRNPKDTYNVVLRRMAYHLDCDDARMDPVKEFPMEIIGLIFSQLDIADLGRCLRVNKQWNRVAQQDNRWNDLRLKRPGNPGKSFAKFLQQHGRMRSLVISDATWFNLTGPKLHQMMSGLSQLDRLCIGFGKRAYVPPTLKSVETKATVRPKCRLTQLSLESFDLQSPLITQLLSSHADTLVTLNLARTGPQPSAVFNKVVLPNLKKLRLTAVLQPSLLPASALIEMKPVVIATPNLEQLHLDGFRAAWLRDGPPTDDWNGLWSSLRRLTLGPAMLCVMDPRSRLWSPRFLPPFPTSLQSLEILSANENVARTVLFTTASPAAAINATALLDGNLMDLNLPQLEVFRCLSSILKPRHLEHILEPSVSAGKLQALELRAAFNHLTPPGGGDQPGDFVPARDLDFLTCSSLHTLGLHDFNFFENPSGRWVATNEFYAEPFVDWLDCFPSLRTLGVYPGDWEAVGLLIPRLIARPGIKAIHQQYLRGLSWDEAQKLARKHGVKLCHSPGHMPAGWRVFEDFDDDTST